jgi:hypothetical protein
MRLNVAGKKKKVDEAMLEKLCKIQLSDSIIADCLDVSVATLHRHFAEKMSVFRSRGLSKIADVLFDEAVNKRQGWAIKLIAERKLDYGGASADLLGDKPVTINLNYSKDSLEKAKK